MKKIERMTDKELEKELLSLAKNGGNVARVKKLRKEATRRFRELQAKAEAKKKQ